MSVVEPNEPLILADGTKINPVNGKVIRDNNSRGGFIEIPNAGEAQALVAKSRRTIAELPVAPQQMNAFSLVLFYSMWGLNDQDIAITIGSNLSVDQIKNIKSLPEYKELSDDILKNVLEYESNDIRTYLQQNAKIAAQKVVTIAQEEDGALGLMASRDILDRAGHRPADIVEHRHKFEDALKIQYIEKKADHSIPVIEADFINITDGRD